MGHNGMFKIYTGIPKRFKRINNKKKVHGIWLQKNKRMQRRDSRDSPLTRQYLDATTDEQPGNDGN
jgi:hypothetical protein